jgi:hypothetical protein
VAVELEDDELVVVRPTAAEVAVDAEREVVVVKEIVSPTGGWRQWESNEFSSRSLHGREMPGLHGNWIVAPMRR